MARFNRLADQSALDWAGARARVLQEWDGFRVLWAQGPLAGQAAQQLALFVQSGTPVLEHAGMCLQMSRGDTAYLPAGSSFKLKGAQDTLAIEAHGAAPPGPAFIGAGGGETISMVGDTYHLKLRGRETAGLFSLFHFEVPPGGGPPPHSHTREDEVFVYLDGTIRLNGELDGHTGDAVFLPRDERHFFRNESESPAEYLAIIAPAGLEKMFQDVGSQAGPQQPERLQAVAAEYGLTLG